MKKIIAAGAVGILNLVVSLAAAAAIVILFGFWLESHPGPSFVDTHPLPFYGTLLVLVIGSVALPVRRRMRERRLNILDFPCLILVLLAGFFYLCFQGVFGEAITKYF